jgi:formylglycine-generating enzyme required for sulfatase activity
VWEWCQDWFGEGYYDESDDDDPAGPPSGGSRVLRGGSWGIVASYCRSAVRGRNAPASHRCSDGFRVASQASFCGLPVGQVLTVQVTRFEGDKVIVDLGLPSLEGTVLLSQWREPYKQLDLGYWVRVRLESMAKDGRSIQCARHRTADKSTASVGRSGFPSPEEAFFPMTVEQARHAQVVASRSLGLPKDLQIDCGCEVNMELVLIPAGAFTMGSPESESERQETEAPRHKVWITKPFYMGRCEVTQGQWQAVMGNNPLEFEGDANLPVHGVSWDDCQGFCRTLASTTGKQIRLPTEAEWEYACRAGSATAYNYGDAKGNLGGYAWYNNNSHGKTHPVGQKHANAWGLYDMHGNVCEWCEDWFGPDYYSQSPMEDPRGPQSGDYRGQRGGSFSHYADSCRSACRGGAMPDGRFCLYGFRVVSGTP